jgi:hypothetical protein
MADPLFAVRNSFYLGAYNLVVQEASELEGLPDAAAIERDSYLYRAYIALGSHQARGGTLCLECLTLALLTPLPLLPTAGHQ